MLFDTIIISVMFTALPCEGGGRFLSFITILTLYIFVPKQSKMKKPTKRLLWTEAYKLMNARTPDGKNKPFDIRFVCKDGTISECYNVQRAVSYNREKGYRKLVMPNGDFRYVYDVLILQINDTKILVK